MLNVSINAAAWSRSRCQQGSSRARQRVGAAGMTAHEGSTGHCTCFRSLSGAAAAPQETQQKRQGGELLERLERLPGGSMSGSKRRLSVEETVDQKVAGTRAPPRRSDSALALRRAWRTVRFPE